MARSVSIHVGVNHPGGGRSHPALAHSEATAWRMAGLATRAGYGSVLMLRGSEATRQAVHDALAGAARALAAGDVLFVSFSGHGAQARDLDQDEGHDGWDESWCLYDGDLLDDKLAGYWRLFDPGVRILVVAENCFGGGGMRGRDCEAGIAPARAPAAPVYRAVRGVPAPRRGPLPTPGPSAEVAGPCVGVPDDTYGIRASLLLLAACKERQLAQDGLFSRHLFAIWDDGAFRGTFCELYRLVRQRVMEDGCRQEPHIQMLGAPDRPFPLETAFHLNPRATPPQVYR